MQSLINWTYGNCPYNEGKYLILVKLPGGGHKISVDCYVIMPNHIHLIIELFNGSMWASTPTIPQIIKSLKIMITKGIGHSIWQRNYYEHIIRNEKEYFKIKE